LTVIYRCPKTVRWQSYSNWKVNSLTISASLSSEQSEADASPSGSHHTSLLFFTGYFLIMNSFTRCSGRANHSSRLSANIRPSIVQNLMSRSITGRGLGVKVHHFGYMLHMVWNTDVGWEMCFERGFLTYRGRGVLQPASLGTLHLCDCVSLPTPMPTQ
jgi:hypothetical protein